MPVILSLHCHLYLFLHHLVLLGGSYLLERVPVILSLHCHHVSVSTSSCFIGRFIPTGKSACNPLPSLSSRVCVHHLFTYIILFYCFYIILGGSYLLERVPVILSLHCHHVSVCTSSCFIGRFIPTGKSACNPLPHCHHVSVCTSSCFIGRFIPTGKSACNPLPSLSSRVCLYIILFYWGVHTYWKECL